MILPTANSSTFTQQEAGEPIGLDDVKRHLNIASTTQDDDILIGRQLIPSARAFVESEVSGGLALKLQTYTWTSTGFPTRSDAPYVLPISPLYRVDSVGSVDTSGSTQTMASTDYTVMRDQSRPGYIVPQYSRSWPAVRAQVDAVQIQFVAGMLSTDVPPQALHMLRLICGDWYKYRENQVEGRLSQPVQTGIDRLARQLNWGHYG